MQHFSLIRYPKRLHISRKVHLTPNNFPLPRLLLRVRVFLQNSFQQIGGRIGYQHSSWGRRHALDNSRGRSLHLHILVQGGKSSPFSLLIDSDLTRIPPEAGLEIYGAHSKILDRRPPTLIFPHLIGTLYIRQQPVLL